MELDSKKIREFIGFQSRGLVPQSQTVEHPQKKQRPDTSPFIGQQQTWLPPLGPSREVHLLNCKVVTLVNSQFIFVDITKVAVQCVRLEQSRASQLTSSVKDSGPF